MRQSLPCSWSGGLPHTHPPCATGAVEAQFEAFEATESPSQHTSVFLLFQRSYVHSLSHLQPFKYLLLLSVPGLDHRGFLLQELGAGNSKRDSSLGMGVTHSLLCGEAHSDVIGILHSASPCLFRQITQQNQMGIFSTYV